MRTRFWALSLLTLACSAEQGLAQPGNRSFGPHRSPTVSPYLNMLGRGRSPAINYFGIVRPEFQAQDAFQNLQQQVNTNRRSISDIDAENSALPPTGDKTVSFLNTGGYFMNLNPQSGNAGGGGSGGGGSGFGTLGGMSGSGVGGSGGRSAPSRR